MNASARAAAKATHADAVIMSPPYGMTMVWGTDAGLVPHGFTATTTTVYDPGPT